jgi:hypothetical protein
VRAILETADRFTWREGDLQIVYNPREEEKPKER